MKELIDKLSSYNIFTYLFPGVLFVLLLKYFTSYIFIIDDIILGGFLYYFIGMIVSRIGSFLIEPLLKKLKFVKFAKYSDFVSSAKEDSKIELLSEVNNMFRAICSMLVLLLVFILYEWVSLKFDFLIEFQKYILIVLLLILFLFSYRKQTGYIKKRVDLNNNSDVDLKT